jgi:nitrile hydratase beta subunit
MQIQLNKNNKREETMNSVADMGGQQNYGKVPIEKGYSYEHEWEFRAQAARSSYSRLIKKEHFVRRRYMLECLPPVDYLTMRYSERLLYGTMTCLIESGVLTLEEITQRAKALAEGSYVYTPPTDEPKEFGDLVVQQARKGSPTLREADIEPRYQIGDKVRIKNFHPKGHTRLPMYARGKQGIIVGYHGCHVFDDANAAGKGEMPQPLYSVAFESTELWGEDGKPGDKVYLDMWEDYIKDLLKNESV